MLKIMNKLKKKHVKFKHTELFAHEPKNIGFHTNSRENFHDHNYRTHNDTITTFRCEYCLIFSNFREKHENDAHRSTGENVLKLQATVKAFAHYGAPLCTNRLHVYECAHALKCNKMYEYNSNYIIQR